MNAPSIQTFTDEQIADRKNYIGASEISKVVKGEWSELYEIKTGQAQGADLSGVFPVQLGIMTEKLNIAWRMFSDPELFTDMDRAKNHDVIERHPVAESYSYAKFPILRATPDAWCTFNGEPAVLECKHTNPDAWRHASPADRLLDTYCWQLTQQMMCTDTRVAILSPIYGNKWGDAIIFKYDQDLADVILSQAKKFWKHIEHGVPPLDSIYTPAIEIVPVDKRKAYSKEDLKTLNTFSELQDACTIWRANRNNADQFDKAKKQIKQLMPIDARSAELNGLLMTRSKSNSVTIKEAH